MATPGNFKEVDVSGMCLGKGATVHGAFVGTVSQIKLSMAVLVMFSTLMVIFSDGIKTVRT